MNKQKMLIFTGDVNYILINLKLPSYQKKMKYFHQEVWKIYGVGIFSNYASST